MVPALHHGKGQRHEPRDSEGGGQTHRVGVAHGLLFPRRRHGTKADSFGGCGETHKDVASQNVSRQMDLRRVKLRDKFWMQSESAETNTRPSSSRLTGGPQSSSSWAMCAWRGLETRRLLNRRPRCFQRSERRRGARGSDCWAIHEGAEVAVG